MISLIHPSRGRPQKANDTAKRWIDLSGTPVEHILSLDWDDAASYQHLNWDKVIMNRNTSVVDATNHAAKESKGDILLYLSDDFDCFPDWGVSVEKAVKDLGGSWLLKVDDCLQPFNVAVLTIPIMSRGLYQRLGYFWYPEYKSMFVDEDLYWTCSKMGVLRNAEHLKFPHNHVSIGKAQDDETYRASARNWDQGKALFARRKQAGFE